MTVDHARGTAPTLFTFRGVSDNDVKLVHTFLERIGENPEREGLRETPQRFWDAWLDYFAVGYGQDAKEVLKTFTDGAEGYDELVFCGNIGVFSYCEHHLVPFFGIAHVGYIPNGKIVGLSKLARVVEVFARRLQTQERITTQVADALWDNLSPQAVGVVLRCRHLCMESRGIEKVGSVTYTSALRGDFRDDVASRSEFLAFVTRADTKSQL